MAWKFDSVCVGGGGVDGGASKILLCRSAIGRPNLYIRTLYSNSEQKFILLFLNALHIGREPLLDSLSLVLHIKEGPEWERQRMCYTFECFRTYTKLAMLAIKAYIEESKNISAKKKYILKPRVSWVLL